MDAEQLTRIINISAEAVGKSIFGPMIDSNVDQNQVMKKTINPVCFQIFMVVLAESVSAGFNQAEPRKSNLN